MNYLEHILTCAAEECGEVSKEIHKALRFGLDDRVTLNPDGPRNTQGPTNRDKIVEELNDLMGVLQMLENCGALPRAWQDSTRQKCKVAKVQAYMRYATDIGTLEPAQNGLNKRFLARPAIPSVSPLPSSYSPETAVPQAADRSSA